jgi:Flp pilus assembly protein TadG
MTHICVSSDSPRDGKGPSISLLLCGDRGAITIMFALCASMMVGAMCTALDAISYEMTQTRLQSALDVATLSAGADLSHYASTTGASLTQWQADAKAYFDANMPTNYFNFTLAAPKFAASVSGTPAAGQTINLSATGTMPLLAPIIFGTAAAGNGSPSSSSPVPGDTEPVSASNSAIRIPQSLLELVMVLDNTGSMADAASTTSSGSKIAGLRTAATSLVNDLLGQSSTTSYVGLVPFANMVSVKGSLPPDGLWLTPSFAYNPNNVSMTSSDSTHPGWGGCPVEPHDSAGNVYPLAYSPAATSKFTPFFYNAPQSGLTIDSFKSSSNYVNSKNTCSAPSTSTVVKSVPFSIATSSALANWCTGSPQGQGVPAEVDQVAGQSQTVITQNYNCVATTSGTTGIQPVTFLTTNQTTLTTAIGKMTPGGSTIIPLGLLWGWRMLSSSWSNSVLSQNAQTSGTPGLATSGWISSDPTLPKPEATQGLQRVLVVLTDGQNQIGGSGQFINDLYFNGLSGVASRTLSAPTVTRSDGSSLSNGLMDSSELHGGNPFASGGSGWPDDVNTFQQAVCTAIKNDNVTIFAITFGTDASSSSAQQNMLNCASPGDYYHAPDGPTLTGIFQEIAGRLGALRLTQ